MNIHLEWARITRCMDKCLIRGIPACAVHLPRCQPLYPSVYLSLCVCVCVCVCGEWVVIISCQRVTSPWLAELRVTSSCDVTASLHVSCVCLLMAHSSPTSSSSSSSWVGGLGWAAWQLLTWFLGSGAKMKPGTGQPSPASSPSYISGLSSLIYTSVYRGVSAVYTVERQLTCSRTTVMWC